MIIMFYISMLLWHSSFTLAVPHREYCQFPSVGKSGPPGSVGFLLPSTIWCLVPSPLPPV
jgi:hypothetical protein